MEAKTLTCPMGQPLFMNTAISLTVVCPLPDPHFYLLFLMAGICGLLCCQVKEREAREATMGFLQPQPGIDIYHYSSAHFTSSLQTQRGLEEPSFMCPGEKIMSTSTRKGRC